MGCYSEYIPALIFSVLCVAYDCNDVNVSAIIDGGHQRP